MDDTRQARDTTVQWLPEAQATAYGTKPGMAPQVAWQEVVPVLEVRSARSHADVRAWVDHMALLHKREAALSAELLHHQQHALGSDKPPSRHSTTAVVAVRAAARPSSTPTPAGWAAVQDQKACEHSLRQLRQQLWSQLATVRQAVKTANHLASHSRPGDSAYVVQLAGAVDKADQALGDVKRQQASGFRALMEQQAQLEEEVEEAAGRLEQLEYLEGEGERWEEEQATGAQAQGKGRSGGWQPGAAAQQQQQRRSSTGGWVRSGAAAAGGEGDGGRRGSPGPVREAWAAGPSSRAGKPGVRAVSGGGGRGAGAGPSSGGCLAPEVVEFEEFVAERGETGGWPKEDHEEFVRVVQACGGDYARAVAVVMDNVIGYSRTEVMSHATWHMDYMDLMVRKRAAVTRWRQQRDKERAAAAAAAALLVSEGEAGEQAGLRHGDDTRHRVAATREHQVNKEMVAQWRQAQEERRRQRECEAAEAARRAQERSRLDAEQRRQENEAKLEMHRRARTCMQRQAAMAAALQAAAAEQAAAEASADPARQQRLQERNQGLLLRRGALLAEKHEAATARAAAQRRLLAQQGGGVTAAADPARLLRGTQAHVRRVAARQEEGMQPKDSGFILKLGAHLSVPSWRAGA